MWYILDMFYIYIRILQVYRWKLFIKPDDKSNKAIKLIPNLWMNQYIELMNDYIVFINYAPI